MLRKWRAILKFKIGQRVTDTQDNTTGVIIAIYHSKYLIKWDNWVYEGEERFESMECEVTGETFRYSGNDGVYYQNERELEAIPAIKATNLARRMYPDYIERDGYLYEI